MALVAAHMWHSHVVVRSARLMATGREARPAAPNDAINDNGCANNRLLRTEVSSQKPAIIFDSSSRFLF
jgi:hypothetical protein